MRKKFIFGYLIAAAALAERAQAEEQNAIVLFDTATSCDKLGTNSFWGCRTAPAEIKLLADETQASLGDLVSKNQALSLLEKEALVLLSSDCSANGPITATLGSHDVALNSPQIVPLESFSAQVNLNLSSFTAIGQQCQIKLEQSLVYFKTQALLPLIVLTQKNIGVLDLSLSLISSQAILEAQAKEELKNTLKSARTTFQAELEALQLSQSAAVEVLERIARIKANVNSIEFALSSLSSECSANCIANSGAETVVSALKETNSNLRLDLAAIREFLEFEFDRVNSSSVEIAEKIKTDLQNLMGAIQ